METWEAISGEPDPDMVRGMEDLRRGAREREQGRIEDAVDNATGDQNGN